MDDETVSIARSLAVSGAFRLGKFKLKSGVVSPYYIDLAWLLSSPADFNNVVNIVASHIRKVACSSPINKLATIELKGALVLPSVASKLNMPCIVVRKEEKAYGSTGRIAGGVVEEGDRFLFFDDVLTDGESKIEGMRPIESMGGRIEAVLVIVDREQGGRERLEGLGYTVTSITTISEIVENLLGMGMLSADKAAEIREYVSSLRET
ncbi:MAG: hypothetical protein RMJ07_04665 [Nitrososphaerota archaeon]|nr:hypothetical protein [Candidatus Bathyarchaeota archaeon]MDW8048957.1 hypothetical protein [Nitrososphaerota archaeon]